MQSLLLDVFSSDHLGDYQHLKPIVDFLNLVTVPLTIVLAVAGGLMSVFIVVALLKSDNPDKQREMKKRNGGLIITVLSVIIVVWLLRIVLANFSDIMTMFRSAFDFTQS